MGSWLSKIKAVPGIGVFDSAEFVHPDAGWVQPTTEEFSGMNRCKWSNTGWADQYAGDNPKSGPELTWTNVELLSIDATNPTTLFGICFGEEPFNGDPILVVKAYRGSTLQTFGVGGFPTTCNSDCYTIKCSYFRRVYSDAQTYTESECIGTNFVYQARILKPSSGTISDIQNYLEFFKWNNDWWFGISSTGMGTDGQTRVGNFTLQWPTGDAMEGVFGDDEPTPSDPTSPEFGPAAKPKGGYNEKSHRKGTFNDTSDKITASNAPTLSPLSTELMHCYKVNQSILNKIATAMYPDYILSQPTVEEALEAIFNQIHYNKMVDYLLDLMILPIDVPAPHTVRVKVGGKTLKTADDPWIEANLIQNPYVDFSCGELAIPEYWANFLDFAGTKFKLFLPYVGYVDLQPEYINGGSISVDYRFNVLDGSFICFIHSTSGHSELEESLIGQYAGVAAVHIPLQSTDYAAKVSGLISAVGTVAAGITTGGVGAGIAASANAVIQKPGTTHANGYNASSSYLSHRTPYLIIERQASQFSEKYPEEVGLPLYMQKRLGDCVGLTVASDAHLDTIPANAEVKEMISRLLSEGVIL